MGDELTPPNAPPTHPPWRLRPRLSLRTLMILVAGVALLLGTVSTRRYSAQRQYYLARARLYEVRAREFADKAADARRRAHDLLKEAETSAPEEAVKQRKWADDELLRATLYRRVADFDAKQEARFKTAADRPWDTPPPEFSDPEAETRASMEP